MQHVFMGVRRLRMIAAAGAAMVEVFEMSDDSVENVLERDLEHFLKK
jgi:hypothetical protein